MFYKNNSEDFMLNRIFTWSRTLVW